VDITIFKGEILIDNQLGDWQLVWEVRGPLMIYHSKGVVIDEKSDKGSNPQLVP
jgi:hypothetical protein